VPRYSEAFKAKMVRKMLPPSSMTAAALADEVGVSLPTLSRWLAAARNVPVMNKPPKKRTAAEKLRVVVESGRLNDAELGEFLRREGVHEAQLNEWRKSAEAALADAPRSTKKKTPESKRIKALERELKRKDKALAEAAAILVLKKKVAEIWGDEDDSMTEGNEP
jgi:transposase